MKFSIIVPVYNVKEYVQKCLESIAEQSYQNYEVIIVNDGSTDDSAKIIKKFIKDKNNFNYYEKENGGLSSARNYGLKYVIGDYLLFVDSDDYLSKDLLKNLNKVINKNHEDIVKFNLNIINGSKNRTMIKKEFVNLPADEAIPLLLEEELFEPAWLYCYKTSFWQKYNFAYDKGRRLHEDFGLTPLILMEAKNITNINYSGYNYVIHKGSIMTSNDKEKRLIKYYDCLNFYEENIVKITECNNINDYTKKLLKSYYANGVINHLKTLDSISYRSELKYLKEIKLFNYLMADNWQRKLKKWGYKYFPTLFIKREVQNEEN